MDPSTIFGQTLHNGQPAHLFISPHQYVQGHGVLDRLGEYLAISLSGSVGVLITPGRKKNLGERISKSLTSAGFRVSETVFQGESTVEEVRRAAEFFRTCETPIQAVIGVGGGKCLDAARMAALQLGISTVCIPTTASTDAPTAAHSVLYDEHGVFQSVEFSPVSPLLVLADVDVLAAAPERYLVAGMGDAFSTYFEARCCMENPQGRTARGARPTRAALAIARQCNDVLLECGAAALEELRSKQIGPALHQIIEANILLSGLGFESGGLAGAHAVAQGLTVINELHEKFLHGELVAIGIMAQLILEQRMDEADTAIRFMKSVGLPLHLGQLGFDPHQRDAELDLIVKHALDVFFIRNEPFEVTKENLKAALLKAYDFGRRYRPV
ncbi:MAG: hypothetical protein A2X46_01745 [Lentisphaerae bacterium GWF2_57_35]|nr:MAG: hypothetical protein A2X46_01745 [Lentisphaerae bacterium GWF2_57_35]